MTRSLLVGSLFPWLVACGGRAEPSHPAVVTRPRVAPEVNPECESDKSQLTVRLAQGQPTVTPVGIEVTFVGTFHDDHDDGRFEDWISLRFRRGEEVENRIVSVHAPRRASVIFDACWQLGERLRDPLELVFMPKATASEPQP